MLGSRHVRACATGVLAAGRDRGSCKELLDPASTGWSVPPIIGRGANQLPYQRAKLARALGDQNAHYRLDEIHARHWQRLAASCGPGITGRMTAMVEEVDNALQAVERRLPAGFPNRVWSRVTESMRRQLAQFLRSAV